jgi:hypothetical protein
VVDHEMRMLATSLSLIKKHHAQQQLVRSASRARRHDLFQVDSST